MTNGPIRNNYRITIVTFASTISSVHELDLQCEPLAYLRRIVHNELIVQQRAAFDVGWFWSALGHAHTALAWQCAALERTRNSLASSPRRVALRMPALTLGFILVGQPFWVGGGAG